MTRENLLALLRTRYTTKHYEAGRTIAPEDWRVLEESLRLAPTSVNGQYTRFYVAKSEHAKAEVTAAALDFNKPRVADCAGIVVFAVPRRPEEAHLQAVLAQEIADGRFGETTDTEGLDAGRRHFTALNNTDERAFEAWTRAQSYLAMGFLLMTAAGLGIDSTCLEGMDFDELDRRLGLREEGFKSVCAVALGYRAAEDANATRPKSRLPLNVVVREL